MTRQQAVRIALGILALLAAVSLAVGLRNANLEFGSVDFQYSPARLLLQGYNPYAVFLIDRSRFLLTQGPPYLPLLYLLLLPIGALDWPTARLVWSVINTLIGLYVAFRLYRGFGAARAAPQIGLIAALIFIGSTPFRNTIGNGQQGLLIVAALILALDSRSVLAKGALLALASTKLSLGAMFVALCAGLRMWLVVAGCGAVTLASYAIFAAMTHSPFDLHLLLGPVRAVRMDYNYTPPINWLVELSGPTSAVLVVVGILAAFFLGVLWFRRGRPDIELAGPIPHRLVFAATLIALISAPHLIYDYVALALPFVFGDPFKLLSHWGGLLFGLILATVCIGQKLAFAIFPLQIYELLFAAMWLGLVILAWDCLRGARDSG